MKLYQRTNPTLHTASTNTTAVKVEVVSMNLYVPHAWYVRIYIRIYIDTYFSVRAGEGMRTYLQTDTKTDRPTDMQIDRQTGSNENAHKCIHDTCMQTHAIYIPS